MSSTFEYSIVSLNDGLYDDDVATNLAETFDCCVNDGKLDGQQVVQAFVASGSRRAIRTAEPRLRRRKVRFRVGKPAGNVHASAVSGAALTEIRSLARLLGGMVRGVVPAEDRPPLPNRVRWILVRRPEGDVSPAA